MKIATGRCVHCRLPVPEGSPDPLYCCAGCRVVAGLIEGGDLTRFYELGGGQPVGAPPRPARRDWLDEVIDRGRLAGGEVRVRLDVQGIHCAGCVWLLTELWRRRAGARRIDVNPALGTMTLVYDAGGLDLIAYLDEVEGFGYRTAPPAKAADRSGDEGLLIRLGICAALAMNAMVFAFAGHFGMGAEDVEVFALFRGLSFALATAAVLVGGPVFFRSALAGARRRVLHLDQPISAGILLAYSGSAFQHFAGTGTGYFDTVTVFVALMLAGRFLQRRAVGRNRNYLLANTGADDLRARVVGPSGVQPVPLARIRRGDRLLLSPGDLVPAPSRVPRGGVFSLDWINGESAPREVPAGGTVPAGAFLRSGEAVTVEALADVNHSDLLGLLATPADDRDDRVRSRFWSRLNRGYVAGVFLLAAVAALVWLFVDSSRAVEVAVSVLVVTCPCALGLATPLAFELALARLRRRGVYVRTTSLLEKARAVRRVIFDKTGTLTWGELQATVLRPVPDPLRDLLLTMAHSSGHPVSRSIATAVQRDRDRFECLDLRVEEIPGEGLRALYRGHEFRLGSESYVLGDRATGHRATGHRAAGHRANGRENLCLFSRDGHVEACFLIEESVRAGFRSELHELRQRGLEVLVLSGDRQARVDAVADALGLPRSLARGDLGPRDKAEFIAAVDRSDTLMVGDGLNDAPAFEAAFCAGAAALDRPVMPSRADFFFLGGGSAAVRSVLDTARRLHRVVVANLWLAALYNGIALAFCFAGMMTPLLCAVLMPLSSLVIVWHSVARLRA